MNLKEAEVTRFYKVWLPLLHYVNQKRDLIESFEADWPNSSIHPQEAMVLRNAMWADDSLRHDFIDENPVGLSDEELALAKSWDTRVEGEFFIFRYLKKHTIFISGEGAKGYGVLGIVSPIEEIVGPYTPIYVKTVLVPFEDRIIYDSLLSPYPVSFGSGIKGSLNDTYREIREREELITTFTPPNDEEKREQVLSSNKKVLKAFQKDLGKAGLSPKKMQEHFENVEAFSDDFLLTAEPPIKLLDITVDDLERYIDKEPEANRVSFKRFARFLRDTGRVYYPDAEEMLDFLKYA